MAVLRDKIVIKNLSKTFASKKNSVEVLKDINLTVKENEFLVILGPGQCGKTVLLNILAELDEQTSGTVEFADGRPKMGDLGLVFQRYALFPWKSVMGNVEMNQKLKGVDKATRQANAQKYIDLVGLQGFEKALPKQLSGGMKQRVGIARAYANSPNIMLLDEPFGQLDAQTRMFMQKETARIWEQEKRTVIFVTNNIDEALFLGDRIILMEGKLPGSIKTEYMIDLPRPREHTSMELLKLRSIITDNTALVL